MGKRKAPTALDNDVCPMEIDWDASVENVKPAKKQRKAYIPKAVKMKVWSNTFGLSVGQAYCPVCTSNLISQMDFHCGHIIAESQGGETTVSNLRPICAPCNLSMGKKNLTKFKTKYFK
jgi:5-methylcytosine-specific restriction endonuclease McrA